MKVYCYYHNDMDGKCSGAIVKQHLKEAVMIKVDNPDISHPDFSQVELGDCVYLVDLSVGFDGFMDLLERTQHVIWIDHHSSSIKTLESLRNVYELESFPKFKHFLNTEDGAACVLVWQWFDGYKAYPVSVHLTSLYDTWKYVLGDRVMLFNLGCTALGLEPDDPFWRTLLEVESKEADDLIHEIINKGRDILRYQESRSEELRNYKHFAELVDIDFVAINTDASNIFLRKSGAKYVDPEACRLLLYHKCGDKWVYHIYGDEENQVDLATLARSYGGGGHRNAAGFTLDYLIRFTEN